MTGRGRIDSEENALGDNEDQGGGEPCEGPFEPFRLPLMELVHLFGDRYLSGNNLAGDLVRGQVEKIGLVETIEPVATKAFVDTRPKNPARTTNRERSGDQGCDEGDAKRPVGFGVEDASFLRESEKQRHQGDDGEDDPTARALLSILSGIALIDLGREQLIREADICFTVRLCGPISHGGEIIAAPGRTFGTGSLRRAAWCDRRVPYPKVTRAAAVWAVLAETRGLSRSPSAGPTHFGGRFQTRSCPTTNLHHIA